MKIYALFNRLGKIVSGGSAQLKTNLNLKLLDAAVEKHEEGDWRTLDLKKAITVQPVNMRHEKTPSFPMGVFSVKKQYLGVANNTLEFAILWNSNADNNQVATIVPSPKPGKFLMVKKVSKTPPVYGLRFFTFECKDRLDGLMLPTDGIVLVNNTAYKVMDLNPQLPGRIGQIDTIDLSNDMDQVTPMYDKSMARVVTLQNLDADPNVYKPVKVFHNEQGAFSWDSAHIRNTGGHLPKHCQWLNGWSIDMYVQNIRLQNFANFNELDSLKTLGITGNWTGGTLYNLRQEVANVDLSNVYETLVSFHVSFALGSEGLDGWGVHRMKNLRKLTTRNWGTSPSSLFAANYPKNLQFILLNFSPNTTTADADAMVIAAANALKGVVPQGSWKRMFFKRNIATPFSEASAAARAQLMAAGWNVN